MAEFFADFFLGLVADFVVGLCARAAAEAKGGEGRVARADRGRCFARLGCDCRQTNNAAGLK